MHDLLFLKLCILCLKFWDSVHKQTTNKRFVKPQWFLDVFGPIPKTLANDSLARTLAADEVHPRSLQWALAPPPHGPSERQSLDPPSEWEGHERSIWQVKPGRRTISFKRHGSEHDVSTMRTLECFECTQKHWGLLSATKAWLPGYENTIFFTKQLCCEGFSILA